MSQDSDPDLPVTGSLISRTRRSPSPSSSPAQRARERVAGIGSDDIEHIVKIQASSASGEPAAPPPPPPPSDSHTDETAGLRRRFNNEGDQHGESHHVSAKDLLNSPQSGGLLRAEGS